MTFRKYKKQRYHYQENKNVNTRNDQKQRKIVMWIPWMIRNKNISIRIMIRKKIIIRWLSGNIRNKDIITRKTITWYQEWSETKENNNVITRKDQKHRYQYQDNDRKKNHNKVTFRKYKKQRYHYQTNNNVNTRNDLKQKYQYINKTMKTQEWCWKAAWNMNLQAHFVWPCLLDPCLV